MGGPAIINNKPYNEFDNFYRCKFEYGGYAWTSSEQCFQALKFYDPFTQVLTNDNYSHFLEIQNTHDPQHCWMMGQDRRYKIRDDWNTVADNGYETRVNVMYDVCRAKVVQNPEMKTKLIQSNGIIQFQQSSNFWNRENAGIYTRMREELRR
jgi:predicted NAD-dependent protein-ADP-ribosyltransferase YbiA (DUF1768 family)